ncbi:MAG: hypothetical protein M1819_002321 [Sarea resinae]|nr:MAG: hypothetical protein M1819_002321 [Sarea resinae]
MSESTPRPPHSNPRMRPLVSRRPGQEPSAKKTPKPRTMATPRTSFAAGNSATDAGIETPYSNLRQLAGLIQKPTPNLRASSEGPAAGHSVRRTPATQSRTPRIDGQLRPVLSRRGPPTTPHAIRALQQRRAAALTPGRDRRRSGWMQRETPRDALRGLSRILARTSKPTEPSPQPSLPQSAKGRTVLPEDGLDNDADLPRPRFSLPIGQDDEDDDDFYGPPPQLSEPIDEEGHTQLSVEQPRRAVSEQAYGRFSRESFGSVRFSDRFADLTELGLGGMSEIADESMIPQGMDDVEDLYEDVTMAGEDTRDLRATLLEGNRRHSRPSDIRQPLTDYNDESTFAFQIPGIDEANASSPAREVEGDEGEDEEERQNHEANEIHTAAQKGKGPARTRRKKELKLSRHGIPYPSLPPGVVKNLATTFTRSTGKGKPKLNKETLGAIQQATEWFFEQVSDDLGTYAEHAGRKTIDENDIITLMKR